MPISRCFSLHYRKCGWWVGGEVICTIATVDAFLGGIGWKLDRGRGRGPPQVERYLAQVGPGPWELPTRAPPLPHPSAESSAADYKLTLSIAPKNFCSDKATSSPRSSIR